MGSLSLQGIKSPSYIIPLDHQDNCLPYYSSLPLEESMSSRYCPHESSIHPVICCQMWQWVQTDRTFYSPNGELNPDLWHFGRVSYHYTIRTTVRRNTGNSWDALYCLDYVFSVHFRFSVAKLSEVGAGAVRVVGALDALWLRIPVSPVTFCSLLKNKLFCLCDILKFTEDRTAGELVKYLFE